MLLCRRRTRSRYHETWEPQPQRGPVDLEMAIVLVVVWSALRCSLWIRRASTEPALTCPTRRRCLQQCCTALFALNATAPRAHCSAVLFFCRTKTTGRSSHTAAPHASQRQARWASHLFAKMGWAASFCLWRWADLLAVMLPACRGALYCAVARGRKLRCSAVCAFCTRLWARGLNLFNVTRGFSASADRSFR